MHFQITPGHLRPVSGHVELRKRKRGDQWYARYRLPDGRQVQKRLGPASSGNGRPPEGYFTRRTAKTALDAILTDARRGVLAGVERTGATFTDAVEEWLRYVEAERGVRSTTLREYRASAYKHLVPAFGERRLEQITTRDIERWKAALVAEGRLSRRTVNKLIINLNGIFNRARRVWGLRANPVADVEKLRERYDPADYDWYTPEEVRALVRAAANKIDAAIFVTAAFTGMRMGEVLALRWRDVDFGAETIRVEQQVNDLGEIAPTKGGLVRSVPMVEDVAQALARLGQREHFTGEDDPVFPSVRNAQKIEQVLEAVDYEPEHDEVVVGGFLDRSALRRRFKDARTKAKLRPIRFHDLRHTFGSLVINHANAVEVQEWLGHQDARTTQRYLHYRSRAGEAKRIAAAFAVKRPEPVPSGDALELRG